MIALVALLAAAVPSGAAEPPSFALELTTPEGRIYVDLFAQSEGPVRIPVESEHFEAVQIAHSFEEGSLLRVAVHQVVDDLAIEPVGAYDLSYPREVWQLRGRQLQGMPTAEEKALVEARLPEKVELAELAGLGLEGWSMKLTTSLPDSGPDAQCSCCTCGSLYCCPAEGQCMGCGGCGDCCCAGGGSPGPFDDN